MSKSKNDSKRELNSNGTKQIFNTLYTQLTSGCGRLGCKNLYCASNPTFQPLTKTEAIKVAINYIKKGKNTLQICLSKQKISLEILKALEQEPDSDLKISQYVLEQFSDIETLEISFCEMDNDDKTSSICTKTRSGVDFESLEEVYQLICKTEKASTALRKSLIKACQSFLIGSRVNPRLTYLRIFIILILNPLFLIDPSLNKLIFCLCTGIYKMDKDCGIVLVNWLSKLSKSAFKSLIELMHMGIAIQILSYSNDFVYFNKPVFAFLIFLDLLRDSNNLCKHVDYTEFCDQSINEIICEKQSFSTIVSTDQGQRDISHFYFVLNTAVKSKIIQQESLLKMEQQFRHSFVMSLVGLRIVPRLKIVVNRDTIVNDTLYQLITAKPADLKKPLQIVFANELAVDQGGVKKEFFQLIMRKIFSPDYGMFIYSNVTNDFWFNKDTLDNDSEFELIGIIIGLAIYNGVILNLRFPLVVYMKMMGIPVYSLEHLSCVDQALAKGLKSLLEFEGDVENTFLRNFCIEYTIFGAKKTVELKPGGKDIPLTNKNRKEYVELYAEYVLNKSIEKQFNHFEKGFRNVVSSRIFTWFHWKELELIICGNEELDFKELEKSCKYENGYTKDSPVIKMFWELIHEMSEKDKKKFLAFATGSDRVPISGLGDVKLTISRNGDDQNRLPSAHTCFDHLLLPEYKSKEIFKKKLEILLQNSEGFGLF